MSYIILRLDSTKEPIGIVEIPNDPDKPRIVAQFNVFHYESTTICASWISQAEFETFKELELFLEFGCCFRIDGTVCSIGVYDPKFFYKKDNQVKCKFKKDEAQIPQYCHIVPVPVP